MKIRIRIWIQELFNFQSDYSPLRDRAKLIYSTISQKVVDGFGQKLVDRLGVWQGQIDLIFGEDPKPDLDTRII